MKIRPFLIIIMILFLPTMLVACGSSNTDTAKKYIEAGVNGDKDEAEKQVCDKNKDELLADISAEEKYEIKDLKCEEDGDDVKCTLKANVGDESTDITIETTIAMEDGKVCKIKSVKHNGREILNINTP